QLRCFLFLSLLPPPPRRTLFPYTTLFRSTSVTPIAPPSRDTLLQTLAREPRWDVIVIGGGATGLGTALDAASRGYRTLLLEAARSEEHTSELQSRRDLVCRLLLEKKKKIL